MNRTFRSMASVCSATLVVSLGCASSDATPSDGALPPLRAGQVEVVAGLHDSAPGDVSAGEFTDIRGLAFDRQGRMVVADYGNNQISVFDTDGTLEFSFGQEGQGPSDFQGPCCISIAPGNKLLVLDFGNRRYSEFALGDTMALLLSTVRMPSGPTGRLDRVARNENGAIWHYSSVHGDRGRFGMVRSLLDSVSGNLIVDTLWTPPPDSLGAFVVPYEGAGSVTGSSTFFAPYGALFLRAVGLPGGYASAVSSTYEVTIRSDSGAVKATLRRDVPSPELSPRERERAEELVASLVGRHPSLDGKLEVPAAKPPLAALGVDLDGRLWVTLSRFADSTHIADVYTPDGEFIERREWPGDISLSLFAATDNSALGVQQDSLGIERVVRMSFRESR